MIFTALRIKDNIRLGRHAATNVSVFHVTWWSALVHKTSHYCDQGRTTNRYSEYTLQSIGQSCHQRFPDLESPLSSAFISPAPFSVLPVCSSSAHSSRSPSLSPCCSSKKLPEARAAPLVAKSASHQDAGLLLLFRTRSSQARVLPELGRAPHLPEFPGSGADDSKRDAG